MSDEVAQKEPDTIANQEAVTTASSPAPVPTGGFDPEKTNAVSGEVAFNDHIVIYPGSRLPQFDKGGVKAFAAMGPDRQRLFAMICEDHLTPRTIKASNYAAISNASLVKLVASGVVDWPLSGKEKYCFIYENSLGMPLLRDDTHSGLGMKQDLVLNHIIKPIVSALGDMRNKEIVHGNIRLANIFDGGSQTIERAVLGECLTLPQSYDMPSLYLPISRAMTSPAGRGPSTMADDLYSFGVCLAIMLRHNDPLEGLSEEEILEMKMDEGSYVALTGKDRFTGAILELLRGLLYDDEQQRWTLDEVLIWLDGRRLSPKQAARRAKASRPVLFNDHKYMRPELLAKDLIKNPAEASSLIESGEIEQWLKRAMDNKVGLERYMKAVQIISDEGRGSGGTDKMLTRLSIALDPEGPLRYKNINILPEGIGPALTEAFMMKRDMQAYIDFFMAYFITQWLDVQGKAISDTSSLIGRYDGARAFLRLKGHGGGLERCVYALNPEVQCLSEKTARYYVRSPEDLMICYEKMSKLPNRPVLFFDRHIISFLSAKDRKIIDPYMSEINSTDSYRRTLGEMKSLATIQKRSRMDKFPGIASWMAENLESVYERFHDRELRDETKKKVEKLKDGGDLAKIVALFDDPKIYQEDNVGFRKAMRKYYELEQESTQLERDLANESKFGKDTGRHIACVVSIVLSVIIILGSALSALNGNSIEAFF
jgi:hypothetical protein